MSKAKDMVSLLSMCSAMTGMSSQFEESLENMRDQAYINKIEAQKERERYRHSKEYRDARAKRKSQKQLRKKSQGR